MALSLMNHHTHPLRIDLRGGVALVLAPGQRSAALREELLYDNCNLKQWERAGWITRLPARFADIGKAQEAVAQKAAKKGAKKSAKKAAKKSAKAATKTAAKKAAKKVAKKAAKKVAKKSAKKATKSARAAKAASPAHWPSISRSR